MTKANDPKSLALSGVSSIATDIGEVSLNLLLSDGVLKDVPILGTLVNLYKSGVNVKEHLFRKKVVDLINNISTFTEEELSEFNAQFESDPDFKNRVAEHLTLIIDRLDDLEKTKLLSKAFSAFIKKEINFEQFRRIGRAIERCMIEDLNALSNFERANDAFSEITYELAANGLIKLVQLPQIRSPDANSMYLITEFGELFLKVVIYE